MIVAALLLFCLSIAVIYSSNTVLAFQQLFFGAVGFGLYALLRIFDYRSLLQLIKPLYIAIVLLLVLTFIVGIETRGVIRWIPIGPFNFQPSEFAKPILILTLARFWTKNPPNWINIIKSLGILIPISLLIFRQPDLGTAITMGFIWISLLVVTHAAPIKIFTLVLIFLLFIPLIWFSLQDYQRQRIFGFLEPTQDPQGIGFHVIQSTIAVGSGQLLGRGLGRGTQSRLQFLPEFRTDFIFAFIAEELGFLGSLIVIVLYGIIFYVCFKILSNVSDCFGELVVVGVIAMLFFQITVNIGMNVGLLPITGITLPLLSYGGSSIASTLMAIGLVSSVARYGSKKTKIDTFGL